MKKILRVSTRKSPLALWQAEHVRDFIEAADPTIHCELIPLVTRGDRFLNDTLASQGGKGLFVKELEQALLNHEADIAVHSMKDVPVNLPPHLIIAAYLTREDPRDAFVSQRYENFEALPQGGKVGTASLRRKALLKHYRPDLHVEVLRGNVQTRLKKLEEENFDAIILAAAGLIRLELTDRIKQYLEVTQFIPAITQGILGIECREEDTWIRELLANLNDSTTAQIAKTERAFNRKLGGACHVPVAGFATIHGGQLHMTGLVADPDGQRFIKDEIRGAAAEAEALGIQLAENLLSQGADEILKPYV